MKVQDYARLDATALADLIRRREVSPKEAALAAAEAIARLDGEVGAVVETYPDRIEALDEAALAAGPFRGVPFLIKDVTGHEKGRRIEFGSRLCAGLVSQVETNYARVVKAAGLNIIGRSNTPEYSMASSSENLLHGATSTPWRKGHAAGGSTGGGAAAVAAGMTPVANGSDIAGSIRIPASWSGGVGLKPSRGRISAGPGVAEGGHGLAMSFVQTRTMRDTAVMLDCLAVPQPGDPVVIWRPEAPWASFLAGARTPLRIGVTVRPLMDHPVDPEVAAAVLAAARTVEDMGHTVEEVTLPFDAAEGISRMAAIWFFEFDRWLDGLGHATGRTPSPETLEPITYATYLMAKGIDGHQFLRGLEWLNRERRALGEAIAPYDAILTPATAETAPPLGPYGMNITDMDLTTWLVHSEKPVQFSFLWNVLGAPALSLPLAMHTNGLPIGVQIAAKPAREDIVIALSADLERAAPWAERTPPLHASRL